MLHRSFTITSLLNGTLTRAPQVDYGFFTYFYFYFFGYDPPPPARLIH